MFTLFNRLQKAYKNGSKFCQRGQKVLGDYDEFNVLFAMPIKKGQYIDSTPSETQLMIYRTHALHSLLSDHVHRRSERLIQSQLPPKEEFILMFRMTQLQRQLYAKLIEVKRAPICAFGAVCKIMNDPSIIFHIIQNKNTIKDSKKNIKEIDIEDEGITEDLKDDVYQRFEDLMKEFVPELVVNSPKMIALFEVIKHLSEDRMLVFSQSLFTLNLIEKCLQEKLNWKKNQNYYSECFPYYLN